jgi:inositol-1,3,4-trisphosphate 5/6-kinase/inositol-tetrakisphosphate 1-kinase
MLEPDERQLEHLAVQIQQKLGLTLFGIDVIIENGTGRYAVIDINSFPGMSVHHFCYLFANMVVEC